MAYPESGPPARRSVFTRMYTGTGAFDIIGRRKRWYLTFGTFAVICVISMLTRGFNLGIEFIGGTEIQFPATGIIASPDERTVKSALSGVLNDINSVQTAGSGGSQTVVVRTPTLDALKQHEAQEALFKAYQPKGLDGNPSIQTISVSAVSSSWGGEITSQALIALAVFLVLVTLFLAFYFERDMAIAALVALVHDLTVTAGVYSMVGFEVTPSTVIGLLTILGFSLYDTVVVFDKVKENSRGLLGLTRRTYAETANLALNQTLMRSINTSLFALLPVAGLLIVGVGVLGVGTLADLAMVQLVGMIAGALSSIFLATPVLVDLKMRDRRYQQQAVRVAERRAKRAAEAQEELDVNDDQAVDTELRKERAYTAAAGVPARQVPARRDSSTRAERTGRGQSIGRPSGKRRR